MVACQGAQCDLLSIAPCCSRGNATGWWAMGEQEVNRHLRSINRNCVRHRRSGLRYFFVLGAAYRARCHANGESRAVASVIGVPCESSFWSWVRELLVG